ncbi:ATP-binding protein [Cohnella candidum]|nr:ATP-binding protein [Cohnella candidum]
MAVHGNTAESEPKVLHLAGESLEELSTLHDFFDNLAGEAGWTGRLANEFKLCCEELVTNTISYGYAESHAAKGIKIAVYGLPHVVTMEITDQATPFNPFETGEPDLTLDVENRPIGGLGVYFVKQMMDEIFYERTEPPGNRLILRKFLLQNLEENP